MLDDSSLSSIQSSARSPSLHPPSSVLLHHPDTLERCPTDFVTPGNVSTRPPTIYFSPLTATVLTPPSGPEARPKTTHQVVGQSLLKYLVHRTLWLFKSFLS